MDHLGRPEGGSVCPHLDSAFTSVAVRWLCVLEEAAPLGLLATGSVASDVVVAGGSVGVVVGDGRADV